MLSKRVVEFHQRIRFTCGTFPKTNASFSKSTTSVHRHLLQYCQSHQSVRYASSNSIVPPVISKAIEAASPTKDDTFPPTDIEEIIKTFGPIPEQPSTAAQKALDILPNGEESLESLGLGGWSPSGIVQSLLEFVHLHTDMSWGWTIVSVAAVMRILCFKLVVRQRQESAKMAVVMPQIQYLQQRILEARQQNDIVQASRYGMELSEFTKNNGTSMFGALKYAAIQGFVLLSFTQALRQMCNLPVPALTTGGFGSIVDLTLTDPTMVLPLVNAGLLYLHLATGKDVKQMFPTKGPLVIHGGMIGISAILFVISMNFHGAIVLYWISSQMVTVVTHRILKIPSVKKYYDLDKYNNPKIAEMQARAKGQKKGLEHLGFWARIKEVQVNNKLADEVKRRAEIDSAAFERAGREPIRKTYKYDITKAKKL